MLVLVASREPGTTRNLVERIPEIRLIAVESAGADGIGGGAIRYGTNGAIKFQVHCKTQLIAAVAWDLVDQPSLRR